MGHATVPAAEFVERVRWIWRRRCVARYSRGRPDRLERYLLPDVAIRWLLRAERLEVTATSYLEPGAALRCSVPMGGTPGPRQLRLRLQRGEPAQRSDHRQL